jgi:hypothetical protein
MFQKVQERKHRADSPSITLGKGNKINFSAPMLREFAKGHRRVTVYVDPENRMIGFQFSEDGDLQISGTNQVICAKVFRDLGVEGDGSRYLVYGAPVGTVVECFAEVPPNV